MTETEKLEKEKLEKEKLEKEKLDAESGEKDVTDSEVKPTLEKVSPLTADEIMELINVSVKEAVRKVYGETKIPDKKDEVEDDKGDDKNIKEYERF